MQEKLDRYLKLESRIDVPALQLVKAWSIGKVQVEVAVRPRRKTGNQLGHFPVPKYGSEMRNTVVVGS